MYMRFWVLGTTHRFELERPTRQILPGRQISAAPLAVEHKYRVYPLLSHTFRNNGAYFFFNYPRRVYLSPMI